MSAALTLGSPATGIADVLSPSQVSVFRDCETRWYYKYQLGLPDKGSPALAAGSAVDVAIKATWHHKVDTGLDLPLTELIDIFAARWTQESAKVEFTAKQNRDEIAAQGAQMIAIYMRDIEPSIHPRDVDLEVRGKINGVQVRGFVDLIDIEGRVIELKTAGRTPNKISPTHAFQLATYAQLAPDISGHTRVDTLVKLKTPKVVQHAHEITLADYHYLRASYPLVQEKMRLGIYDINRNSFLCNRASCPYWSRCESEWGGIVPGGEGDE